MLSPSALRLDLPVFKLLRKYTVSAAEPKAGFWLESIKVDLIANLFFKKIHIEDSTS